MPPIGRNARSRCGPGTTHGCRFIDNSGFLIISSLLPAWKPEATLEEISEIWRGAGYRAIADIDKRLADPAQNDQDRVADLLLKAVAVQLRRRTREELPGA